MSWLLLVVMLLLAITLWLTAKIIVAAHRRATPNAWHEAPTPPHEDQPQAPSLDSFQSPQVLQEFSFEEALQSRISKVANHDAYADPIDGVPFLESEHPIPCSCGVAYRAESLDWLALQCGGRCVQCGSLIQAAQATLV